MMSGLWGPICADAQLLGNKAGREGAAGMFGVIVNALRKITRSS